MCNAFSAIVNRKGEVFWKAGVDSHDKIIEEFKIPPETEEHPAELMFARVEVTPPDDVKYGCLHPELEWSLKIDQTVHPTWFKTRHEEAVLKAFEEWKTQVYSHINLAEALNPVNPFKIEPPATITEEHIKLLRQWAKVRATVGATVWDTVGNTVWDTVGNTVWDTVGNTVRATVRATVRDTVGNTVGDTVWDTVGNTVRAYIGSLFTGVAEWREYPFQSAVDLWRLGLVASYDGETWRLHSKNGVAYKISKKELTGDG